MAAFDCAEGTSDASATNAVFGAAADCRGGKISRTMARECGEEDWEVFCKHDKRRSRSLPSEEAETDEDNGVEENNWCG